MAGQALLLQLFIGFYAEAESPVAPLPQEGCHLLCQRHRFRLGAFPAGNGQIQISLADGSLESHGPGSAAIAQQQHPAGTIHAVVLQGFVAAGPIGCVALHAPCFHLHRVYRTEPARVFLQLIQKGDDGAFVGDGDVETVQRPQGGKGSGQVRHIQHLIRDRAPL